MRVLINGILFFLFIVLSCDSEADLTEPTLETVTEVKSTVAEFPLVIPDGTEIIELSQSTHRIILPNNFYYVAYKAMDELGERNYFLAGDVEITCECNKNAQGTSGGCDPGRYKGQYTCVMQDRCTQCTKTVVKSKTVNDQLIITGMVDFSQGITFITESLTGNFIQDQFLSLEEDVIGNLNSTILEITDVQERIAEFFQSVYADSPEELERVLRGNFPSSDYQYLEVNIFGNKAAIPFDRKRVSEQKLYAKIKAFGAGDDIECNCLSGESGCEKKTAGVGQVKYCDSGDCKKCKLTDKK